MYKKYWMTLLITVMFFLTACGNEIENVQSDVNDVKLEGFVQEYDWPLAAFDAVNQDNEKRTLASYEGKAWIMNMIFTNCTTVCLPMTANMAKLQQSLREENLEVPLVSFSVDPLIDTPEVLKEYGKGYEADFSNWDMLTGYSEEDIRAIAKSVKTLAEKPEGTDQVTHSTKFFLINQDGIAVKGFDGVNTPYEEIISDLKAIQ